MAIDLGKYQLAMEAAEAELQHVAQAIEAKFNQNALQTLEEIRVTASVLAAAEKKRDDYKALYQSMRDAVHSC